MNYDQFFEHHGISLAQVDEVIRGKIGAYHDECVCLTGSLADGHGNSTSDIDVYVFSDRDLSELFHGPIVPISCGSALIDLNIISSLRWMSCIEGLQNAAQGDLQNGLLVAHGDLDLLHRIVVSSSLGRPDELSRLKDQIDRAELKTVLVKRAITGIAALQIDILGAVEAGDMLALEVLIPRQVGHLVDLVIAVQGGSNPSEKWRWHCLKAKCQEFDENHVFDELKRLAFDGGDLHLRAAQVLQRCNQWVPLAQASLLSAPNDDNEPFWLGYPRQASAAIEDERLPCLALDFAIRSGAGNVFKLLRLTGHVEIECNREMAMLAPYFDGVTGQAEMTKRIVAMTGCDRDSARGILTNVATLLQGYDFLDNKFTEAIRKGQQRSPAA